MRSTEDLRPQPPLSPSKFRSAIVRMGSSLLTAQVNKPGLFPRPDIHIGHLVFRGTVNASYSEDARCKATRENLSLAMWARGTVQRWCAQQTLLSRRLTLEKARLFSLPASRLSWRTNPCGSLARTSFWRARASDLD